MIWWAVATFAVLAEPSANVMEYGHPTSVTYRADFRTLKSQERVRQIWVEGDYSHDRSVKFRKTKELWKFDCSNETSATEYFVEYDARGGVVRSGSPREPFEPVVPGTIGSAVMRDVCGKDS